MNAGVRTALQTEKMVTGGNKMVGAQINQQRRNRERILALLDDVDMLKKKLRHEENIRRALERAFTRPLGSLPRLPPHLPSYVLELLAEVAVIEEEVVRLEEQVANFRQGLHQEAVYTCSIKSVENSDDAIDQSSTTRPKHPRSKSLMYTSSIKNLENADDVIDQSSTTRPKHPRSKSLMYTSSIKNLENSDDVIDQSATMRPKHPRSKSLSQSEVNLAISASRLENGKQASGKPNCSSPLICDGRGKENRSYTDSAKNKQSPKKKTAKNSTLAKRVSNKNELEDRCLDSLKLECRLVESERPQSSPSGFSDDRLLETDMTPNKVSEDIVMCLSSIFLRMSRLKNKASDSGILSLELPIFSTERKGEREFWDLYGLPSEFQSQVIGPHKYLWN